METVKLIDLNIGYLTKGHQNVVAQGLNATISSGELTCLLGRNGIGKSTLLRTLSAFQPKLGGQILLNGSDISALSDKALSRLIGIVLTEKPDIRNMTVEELVGLGRSPYTGFWGTLTEEDRHIVSESIHLVGIEPLRQRMVQTLSDGERQKVMIAKALAQQTPIIILDEPTAFLDFPSKVEITLLLQRLAHDMGKTIFLSTHDVELALQTADLLWLLRKAITESAEAPLVIGTPATLADNGVLASFFDAPGITFDAAARRFNINSGGTPRATAP